MGTTTTHCVRTLLETDAVTVRDYVCDGRCRHRSRQECAHATYLVFPYRGVFARHLGRDEVIGEANQVLFFNASEEYQISHPIEGGDACLSLSVDAELLRQLAPGSHLRSGDRLAFRPHRIRIGPGTQALVALLRRGLSRNAVETLEGESLALRLVSQAFGERTTRVTKTTPGKQKLVDRTKLVLASDPGRRWKLAEIAAEVGVSPVYLTQVFAQVEAVPLYRYHLRLRLARALDLLDRYDDLTTLSMDLGFASQSHFGFTFRQMYGRTPAEFKRLANPGSPAAD